VSELSLTLHIWRQASATAPGKIVTYQVAGVSTHASFLEMLDILNEQLIAKGEEPIAFDHDCREGICGTCSLMINGRPHGGRTATTTCQLHMRFFNNNDEIWIEPWRAQAFPVIKDLCVDRSAFDRVMSAGGFVTANVGSAPDANAVPVSKESAEAAMDAAACIGCGACVAACPNGSAMLYVAAKLAHLHHLPQGQPEAAHRTQAMVSAMDAAGFGNCSNHYECEAACPKQIPRDVMAKLNRGYVKASLLHRDRVVKTDGAG
jgi:succinate dehydrogenase / fumarate reductase iron-sulfur subunit